MKNLNTTLAISALVIGAVSAHAAINEGDQLQITGGVLPGTEIGYVSYNGTIDYGYAGAFSVNVVDTTQGLQTTLQTFCTDVNAGWTSGGTYTAVNFAGQNGINPTWSGPMAIEDVAYLYNNYFLGQTLNLDQDAGMQLAIWKLLYDSGATGYVTTDFSSGKFQVVSGFDATAISDAEAYISDVNTALAADDFTVNTYAGLWLKPNDGSSQGLIYTPVPEPSTIFAGAMLLLPLGMSISRVLRKHRAVSVSQQ